MSFALYPLNAGPDASPVKQVSNAIWREITHRAPDVPTWNGFGQEYTPHQLRRLAAANPEHSEWLLELADKHGGAEIG